MALIAVCAVKHVAAPPCVLRIHPGLCMTYRASESLVIRRIGVTIGARSRISTMPGRKPGVVERRSGP
jgi:hypothetical protein